MLLDGLLSTAGLSQRSISVYTTEPSIRCVAVASAMRSHSLPVLHWAVIMLAVKVAVRCTGFVV